MVTVTVTIKYNEKIIRNKRGPNLEDDVTALFINQSAKSINCKYSIGMFLN